VTLPLASIVFAALIIGAEQWGRELDVQHGERLASAAPASAPGAMGPDIVGSSVLGALLLGSFALLCLLRDEAHDRSHGLRTTVTIFGHEASIVGQMVWLALCVVIAVYGVGAGWWPGAGWLVAAIVGVAALICVCCISRQDARRAVRIWYLAASAASILMAVAIVPQASHLELSVPEAPPKQTPANAS